MKVSIDGGGISTTPGNSFGNAVFVQNFLKALSEYDKSNQYIVYVLDKDQVIYDKKNLYFQVLKPTFGWMKMRVPLEELISPKPVFLAINQAVPKTKASVVAFSHGLSFYFYPQLYKDLTKLSRQLSEMKTKSKYIVVSSEKVKNELKQIGFSSSKVKVALFGIPYDFRTAVSQSKEKYFMFVGNNHPIKNVDYICKQFAVFSSQKQYADYCLHLCGPFQNYASDRVKVFTDLSRIKLKNMYQKATAYVTASYYESFNFPVLEALSQNCPVLALESAVIPEMKDFVELVKTEEEFQNRLKKMCEGKAVSINQHRLQNAFSWSKYVKSIIRLYNE
jgi:glycosyltransferase involved in cell wall biosynthesis